MPRPVDYDDSVARAHEPLTADEVAALLAVAGRPVSKDPARVTHLLGRVDATLRAHARQVADLHRDIDTIVATTRRTGTPLQVAVDALAALTDAQREQVLDVTVSTRMAELTERIADADRARTAARSEANRVRFALERLAADPALPPAATESVRATLAALPAPVRSGAPTATPAAAVPAAATTSDGFVPPWQPSAGPSRPGAPEPAGPQPVAGGEPPVEMLTPAPPAEMLSPAPPVSATPAPEPLPVAFQVLEPSAEDPAWQLQAFVAGVCVGSLDVTVDGHAALGLAVDGPFRGRGVATALLDEARARFNALRPGPVSGDGAAFLAAYRARTGWPA